MKKSTGSHPFHLPRNGEIHGEIVCWNWARVTFTYKALVDALELAGFNSKLAREKLPRYAFSQAARKMQENRIIRKTHEDETDIVFQFTAETRSDDGFDYARETLLTLSKLTGRIDSGINELTTQAEVLLSEAMIRRTSSDVSHILKRLFDKNADLFKIRDAGGCYFVPVVHQKFLDQIDVFLRALGCSLSRWPIAKGTGSGDKSVKETIAEGLEKMIVDLNEDINKLGNESSEAIFDRRAERIRLLKFKIESYSVYLDAEKDRLIDELVKADDLLVAKVTEMATRENVST